MSLDAMITCQHKKVNDHVQGIIRCLSNHCFAVADVLRTSCRVTDYEYEDKI